jgi:pimeloyl-ACP methyl ester carboxylesterase
MRNTRKILFSLGLLAVSLPVVGWLYQPVMDWYDRHRYPAPGKMVDVGGYKLHLYGMGEEHSGGPSVILEAGLGSTSLDWYKVQPEIAKFARVYAYERAGVGWSESGPGPRTAMQAVHELHNLLRNAQVPEPYILVGHSYGGLVVRLFADRYPNEVAGLVLVDASHEDQLSVAAISKGTRQSKRSLAMMSVLARFGVVRLSIQAGLLNKELGRYSEAIIPQLKALYAQTRFVRTLAQEMAAFAESCEQVRALRHSYGALPLVVLSQTPEPQQENTKGKKIRHNAVQQAVAAHWQNFQRDQACLSTNSTHIVAEHSSHYIQLDQPELVIEAIRSVLTKAQV